MIDRRITSSCQPSGALRRTCCGLHAALNALGVERTTDNVVTNARKILNTAAADQNDGVLLQVVTNAGNVSGNFITVRQAHTGDLTKSRVRLLRGGGTNSGADTSLLRRRQISRPVLQRVDALLQSRAVDL